MAASHTLNKSVSINVFFESAYLRDFTKPERHGGAVDPRFVHNRTKEVTAKSFIVKILKRPEMPPT